MRLEVRDSSIYVDPGLPGTNRARPGLRETFAAARVGDPHRAQTRPSRPLTARHVTSPTNGLRKASHSVPAEPGTTPPTR
ncbi:hypothetical protein [Tessaracoccus terricola]